MADLGERTIALLSFFMVFAILFPISVFAVTFETPTQDSLGALDPAALQAAGISLTDAISYNMSDPGKNPGFEYFEYHMNDSTKYSVTWSNGTGPDGNGSLSFRTTVFLPVIWVGVQPAPYHIDWMKYGQNWSSTYNWTRFTVDAGGARAAHCFLTPPLEYNGDYLTALKDGNMTVTIGKSFQQGEPDFWGFAGWWFGLITGIDTQGLPEFFAWLLRLIAILGVLSAILLLRSFLPFL